MAFEIDWKELRRGSGGAERGPSEGDTPLATSNLCTSFARTMRGEEAQNRRQSRARRVRELDAVVPARRVARLVAPQLSLPLRPNAVGGWCRGGGLAAAAAAARRRATRASPAAAAAEAAAAFALAHHAARVLSVQGQAGTTLLWVSAPTAPCTRDWSPAGKHRISDGAAKMRGGSAPLSPPCCVCQEH